MLPLRAAAGLGLAVRPMTDSDRPFVAALYASTRTAEIAGFGWPPELTRAFFDQQHRAQEHHYRAVYPGADWLIVEQEGQPIGRLYVEERVQSLHLIDISLVPERRGSGAGSALLADLIAQADSLGKATSLQVEKVNPARRLYERLGFRATADNGLYDAMERPFGPAEG